MRDITKILLAFPYHVKVEGHTDNVPISTTEFPSNWELSTRRASEIVRFFIAQKVPPEQLSAEGFAEYRPVETNYTVEGRSQNRRVEMVIRHGEILKDVLGYSDDEIATIKESGAV